jgi:hypothetical protein
VSQGSDVNASTEDGESLLSIAASSGFYEVCEVDIYFLTMLWIGMYSVLLHDGVSKIHTGP